jgi:hypothetical protein
MSYIIYHTIDTQVLFKNHRTEWTLCSLQLHKSPCKRHSFERMLYAGDNVYVLKYVWSLANRNSQSAMQLYVSRFNLRPVCHVRTHSSRITATNITQTPCSGHVTWKDQNENTLE